MKREKLNIILTEYSALKEEEKNIFSFQFTVLGIWITFIGVLLGVLFSNISSIEEYAFSQSDGKYDKMQEIITNLEIMPQSREIISLLLFILIPGVCAFFGLVWLDLTTRFIKEAHYIFVIEHKILKEYPDPIGFDHFIFEETRDVGFFKINYLYYYIVIGVISLSLVLTLYCLYEFRDLYIVTSFSIIVFCIILLVILFFGVMYIKKILSYSQLKADLISNRHTDTISGTEKATEDISY